MAQEYSPYVLGDTLQGILEGQRKEKRQAMLDELHRQNVESEMADRVSNRAAQAENAKSLAEDRLSRAADRNAQEVQRRAGLYSPGQEMAAGNPDTTFFEKNASGLLDPGQAGSEPLPEGAEGPSMAATPKKFHGLPVQIETKRKTDAQAAAMHKLETLSPVDEAQMSDLQRELLFRAATGAGVPENVLRPKTGGRVLSYSPVTQTLIDTANGKPAGSKGPNDVVENAGRPAAGPATPAPTYWEGTDEAGNKQIYSSGRDPSSAPSRVNFPPGFIVGGKAAPAAHVPAVKPAKVSGQTDKEWLNVNAAYNAAPESLQAEEALTRVAHNVINQSSNSPVVKGFLSTAWDKKAPDGTYPLRYISYDELLSKFTGSHPQFSDAEKSEISSTWSYLKKNK